MVGSGLKEIWETVYAQTTVAQMMTGLGYARSLRVDFLSQLALALQFLESSSVDKTVKEDLQI